MEFLGGGIKDSVMTGLEGIFNELLYKELLLKLLTVLLCLCLCIIRKALGGR